MYNFVRAYSPNIYTVFTGLLSRHLNFQPSLFICYIIGCFSVWHRYYQTGYYLHNYLWWAVDPKVSTYFRQYKPKYDVWLDNSLLLPIFDPVHTERWLLKHYFLTFSLGFWIPIIFFNLNLNFYNVLVWETYTNKWKKYSEKKTSDLSLFE